jgi:hypothetical protein
LFDRLDIEDAAYGGKDNSNDILNHDPVIFIHGNSDIGVGTGNVSLGVLDW